MRAVYLTPELKLALLLFKVDTNGLMLFASVILLKAIRFIFICPGFVGAVYRSATTAFDFTAAFDKLTSTF